MNGRDIAFAIMVGLLAVVLMGVASWQIDAHSERVRKDRQHINDQLDRIEQQIDRLKAEAQVKAAKK
jgi:uncharacterized protein YukE